MPMPEHGLVPKLELVLVLVLEPVLGLMMRRPH